MANHPRHQKHEKLFNCEECGAPICACVALCDDCHDLAHPNFDPENIYNIPSMRQSVEEDRRLRY